MLTAEIQHLSVGRKTDRLRWEEALHYLRESKLPPSYIRGYWARHDEPKIFLDVDHLWDIKAIKDKCYDFLMGSLGVVDFFEIEH
jgi:hypothetical protein